MADLLTDLTALATALENSDAFGEWCGEDEDPAEHIALFGTERRPAFPVAVLSLGAWTRDCVNNTLFYTTPEVLIEFAEVVDKTATNASVFNSLLSSVASIMDDLESQQLTGYAIQKWGPDSENTPVRAEYTAGTDYASFAVRIEGCLR